MKKFFALYREYLKLIKPYRFKYIYVWFVLILLLFTYNASTYVVGTLIDTISSDSQRIFTSLLLIVAILALPILIEPLVFFVKSRIFAAVSKDLINNAYSRVLTLDHAFHTSKQTGKITSMILNGEDTVGMFLWQIEWFLLESIAGCAIPALFIFFIRFDLGIILVLVNLLFLPLLILALNLNIKKRTLLKEIGYERSSLIVDGMSNYETVRIFSREDEESGYLEKHSIKWQKAMVAYQDTFRLIDFLSRLAGVISFMIVVFFVFRYYESGIIKLGAFVVVVSYLIQLVGRIMNVVLGVREILKGIPIAEDLFELMNEKNTILEDTSPVIPPVASGSVEFKKVSFAYENGKKILDNLSIDIKPKQNIALVGPSGGGKSTCVKLLMRYYDITEGSILIDGIDIKKLPLRYLKGSIGLVPQEPSLFNKSILYNIGYALCSDPEKIEDYREQIIEASKRACVYDFIESLPNKFDTVVGERGVKLSGGQKQRIAIARVLLKMPQIVIFDEATSMLDSESEQAIKVAFSELSKDKTTIVIAHRLSTIINCDNIFVIDQGKVVESGTHNELLEKKGLYSRLWDIQSGGFLKQRS